MSESTAVTALIPAHNAAATIERAIRSVRDQVARIVVLDDGSQDDTVEVVEAMALPELSLLRADTNRGIGATRQRLLQSCETDIAVWLDADDEFMPGRVARLRDCIAEGAEWVFDAAELVDSQTGAVIRELPIANFLLGDDGVVWEFARNYIPSLGWAMARTSAAKAIGYNETFPQAEDYDHLLRAILSGGNIRFCPQRGYRYYDYPGSASRDIDRQVAWAEQALSRLDRTAVVRRILLSALSRSDQEKVFAYYLARIRDWEALYNATRHQHGDDWELAHFYGVACYHALQIAEAVRAFGQSLALKETACGYNNRGVCRIRAGDEDGIEDIHRALAMMPHYRDAQNNCREKALAITTFPLRENPIRDVYQ